MVIPALAALAALAALVAQPFQLDDQCFVVVFDEVVDVDAGTSIRTTELSGF